jgi:hypothetical protein
MLLWPDRTTARICRNWCAPMGYGVIGSPTGSGPVSLGSSPGTPATSPRAARCESAPAAAALEAGEPQDQQNHDGPDDGANDADGLEVARLDRVILHEFPEEAADE